MKEQLIRDSVALGVEEPRRVDMLTWVDMRGMGDEVPHYAKVKRPYGPCGAVGCLYGWGRLLVEYGSKEALVAALTRFNTPTDPGDGDLVPDGFPADEEMEGLYNSIRDDGEMQDNGPAALFDLSVDEAHRLTIVNCWPEEFYYPYMLAHWKDDAESKAAVLAMRAEYFIQTGGTDEGRSTPFGSPLFHKRKTEFKFNDGPYRATEEELAHHCYAPQTKEQEM